jgi:pyridoxal phosphate-dependent aminotransferase EpsN
VGYNYRLSNVLAAIGRGQLRALPGRVAARRQIFDTYAGALGDLPGIVFMPEAPWGRGNRWLTCLTIDPAVAGTDCRALHQALEEENIESRPLWKPMHLQPVFEGVEMHGGAVAEGLFRNGICLPSGSSLTDDDLGRIIGIVRNVFHAARKG